jgi:hypothetical protein
MSSSPPALSRLDRVEATGSLETSLFTSAPLPTLRENDNDTHSSGMSILLSATPQSSLQRHASVGSSSSRSSTSTGELAVPPSRPPPVKRRSWWPPSLSLGPKRSTSGTGDPVTVTDKPPKPSRSRTTPNVVPRRSAPTRQWVPVSHEVLGFLERVANDPESLLRPAADGSVSGNFEGLFSRVIAGSADPSRDERFEAAFLTIYQLFATSERLFEILNRRFESTSLDSSMTRSRY